MGSDDSTGLSYRQFNEKTPEAPYTAGRTHEPGGPGLGSLPLHALREAERFVYRVSGPAEGAPVVYLPGVHGCWTPLSRARSRLAHAFRLIEITYPLQPRWTLDHHADELEHLLDNLGIESAHVIGESFGSLVGWQFGLTRAHRTRSHVLVGGFSRAPPLGLAASAGFGLELVWAPVFDSMVDTYVAWKHWRDESRRLTTELPAYPGVRGVHGQRTTANRMRLIQRSDFRRRLPDVQFPVRYLGGAKDRVVPVEREIATLHQLLPALADFQSHLIAGAPHMVIASHPTGSADRIAKWIDAIEKSLSTQDPICEPTGPGPS